MLKFFDFYRIISAGAKYYRYVRIADDVNFASIVNDQCGFFVDAKTYQLREGGYSVDESRLSFSFYEMLVDIITI